MHIRFECEKREVNRHDLLSFVQTQDDILFAYLQSIVPMIGLRFLTIVMFLRLRVQHRQEQRLKQGAHRAFVDRQMLIIILTSIFLFFSTQIHLSLFKILLSTVLISRISRTQSVN